MAMRTFSIVAEACFQTWACFERTKYFEHKVCLSIKCFMRVSARRRVSARVFLYFSTRLGVEKHGPRSQCQRHIDFTVSTWRVQFDFAKSVSI